MCRKPVCVLLMLGSCLTAAAASAQTIVWVSDNKTPSGGVPADQAWVDLLEANGYTVNLDFRNAEGRTLDDAKIEALNAADLIIVSRDSDSGNYDDGDEVSQWNAIERPLILQIAHIMRSNRWRWLDTTNTDNGLSDLEAVDVSHPVFAGVSLDADGRVAVIENSPSSIGNSTDPGNGELIAVRADNGGVWIVEWQTGQEFYPGSGQIAGGPRMYLASGGTGPDGNYNLTAEGETLFLNAVAYMLATFERVPKVKAREPDPADGTIGVTTPLFTWTAGETALLHEVYMGTSPDLGPADLRQPRNPMTLYYHAPGLTAGTTYYWRVDEIEADMTTVHTGDVWSFTAAPLEAFQPAPRDDSQWVDPDADLNWTPGQGAISHGVYFGTDETAVAEGIGDTFKGEQVIPTYELDTLVADTTYYWRVDETDTAGNIHTGEVWSFTVVGAGGGAKGEYWANMSLTGDPAVTRVDPAIDFEWVDGTEPGTNSPDASIPVDQFSCRWTADLQVDHAETYTLITTSDDGVRLWLDGALVVDNWTNHSPTDNRSGPLDLVPGRFYSLKMEHYEDGGGAVAQLWWMSDTDERTIVPRGPLQPPLHAQMPSPPNGAVDVPQDTMLSWVAGDQATAHQVVFGDDEDTVAGAAGGAQQALDNTTYNPGILEWGKTFYWRIDETEADGTVLTGAVWSFATANFIVVEDFESYDDADNRIYLTWIDGVENGTGSYVGYEVALNGTFGETVIVYGGGQSMPLDYNNVNPPYYSETDRTFAVPQNWTVSGVDALVLYVRGSRSNDAEPLYVVVEDSAGNIAVVEHPDPAIATVTQWTEWKIPLSEFGGAGVNLAAVKKMYIGLGDRSALTPGGAGLIFIDDIRVTKP